MDSPSSQTGSQYVAVNVERSETVRLASGVPQGSILDSLLYSGLFAMYVSPIEQVVDAFGIQHHQYADDLMLYLLRHSSTTCRH